MDELSRLASKIDVLQGQISMLSSEMGKHMAAVQATMTERCATRLQAIQTIGGKLDDADERITKVNHRVEALEKEKAKLIGWASCAGFVAATFGWIAKIMFLDKH